jgi:hypothetical protein
MCICINCFYYNPCILNTNLENFQINKNFYPVQTFINLNLFVNFSKDEVEFDVIECNSFLEKPKNWIISKKLKKYI